jgi:DNA-binding PadR family transcriptional regulator
MALKYSILGLLHYKDMHGYRIKAHIEKSFGHMWSINYGQIYPNLKRLRKEGLISMREMSQNGEKGPPRKLYAITEKGRAVFLKWLSSMPEGDMVLRDPFLMRFVFFGFGSKARALEIIAEEIGKYEKQLALRIENSRLWEKESIYVKQISQLGIALNKIFIDWLKHSKKEIDNMG